MSNSSTESSTSSDNEINLVAAKFSALNASSEPEPEPTSSSSQSQQDIPLAELFQQAETLYNKVQKNELPSGEKSYQDLVQSAILAFMKAHRVIKSAAIFSDNEELKDINPNDIKYSFCPFYLGDLLLNLHGMEKRYERLKKSTDYLTQFLDHMLALGIMSEQDQQVYKRGDKPLAPASARNEKIARFKRDKEIAEKLEALVARREKARASSTTVLDDAVLENDEEEKEHVTLLCHSLIGKALAHLTSNKQEMPMAQRMAEMAKAGQQGAREDEGKRVPPPSRPPAVWRLNSPADALGPIPEHMRHLMVQAPVRGTTTQSVVSAIDKAILQRASARTEIFRDPNPPTMDEDTWFKIQVEKGILPAPSSGPAPQEKKSSTSSALSDDEEDSDNEAAQEAAQLKAREWADWTDDNEKGAGKLKTRY